MKMWLSTRKVGIWIKLKSLLEVCWNPKALWQQEMGQWAGWRGVSTGDHDWGLPCGLWASLRPSSWLMQWRKGNINWVERCSLASKVRGRTMTNRAPNAALPQLVCGLTPGLVLGNTGGCESKGEWEKPVIGAVFWPVCACSGHAIVCQLMWKSILHPKLGFAEPLSSAGPGWTLPQGQSWGHLFDASDQR